MENKEYKLKREEYTEQYLSRANDAAKMDHESAKMLATMIGAEYHNDIIVKLTSPEKITVRTEKPVYTDKYTPEGEQVKDENKSTIEDVVIDNPVVEAIVIALPKPTSILKEDVLMYTEGEHLLINSSMANKAFNGIPHGHEYHRVSPFNVIGRIKPEFVTMESDRNKSESGRNFKPKTKKSEIKVG